MEIYVDRADGKAIAVKNNENNDLNIIIIFSTFEKTIKKDDPFEVLRKKRIWDWNMYDFAAAPAPEYIQNLMNEAEKILLCGRQKTIYELPENVKKFLKGYSLD